MSFLVVNTELRGWLHGSGWLVANVFVQPTDVFSNEGNWVLAVTALQPAQLGNTIRHGNKQTVFGFRTRSYHAMWHL